MNRLVLAFRAFWRILTNADFATRAERLFADDRAGEDLRVLAVLQRDGRLIDFLMEDIDGYADAQIGAAVRDIHRGCRKALQSYMTLEPVYAGEENATVTVPAGFDPAEVRLSGRIDGAPPFQGTLKHHGWRAKAVQLPALPGATAEQAVLAPAEVEVA